MTQNTIPINFTKTGVTFRSLPAKIINHKYPCVICNKPCKNRVQDSICCTLCDGWVHKKCADLTLNQFKTYCSPEHSNDPYYCENCRFCYSSPSQNVDDLCCSSTTTLNSLDMTNDIDRLCSNSVFKDIENLQISEYMTISELNIEIEKTPDDILIIHVNAVSIIDEENHDAIDTLLKLLKPIPSILFVSETRVPLSPSDTKLRQAELEGYHKPLLHNSSTSAGGTAIFVSKKLEYVERTDINFNHPDCEACFVEINCKNTNQNPIFGAMNRHPKKNVTFIHQLFRRVFGRFCCAWYETYNDGRL